jgi:site-specific recombinase XerD
VSIATETPDPFDLFDSAIRTPATRKMYHMALDKFMIFCKLEDHADLLTGEKSVIENRLAQYMLHLKSDKYSSSMRNISVSAIKLFYDMNGREDLGWRRLRKMLPQADMPHQDRAYSKEEITQMVKLAQSSRDKAIILIYATSGIRKDALPGIKIRDIKVLDSEKTISLKVYAGEREEYTAFVTPQACRYIIKYLKERFRTLEKLPKDQPMIGNEHYPQMPVTVDSIDHLVDTLARNAGIRQGPAVSDNDIEKENKPRRHPVMLVHGFRKFFNTTLASTDGFKLLHKELLMGHKPGLEGSYMRPSTADLFEEYRKAIKNLTFNLIELAEPSNPS